jgi:hypothetical protein
MKLRWSSRQRWWLLAGGWALLLVLGVGGFIQQSNALDADNSFLDHLYFTLQLAALDFQGADDAINWRLQIVRFAAPLMAAGTLLQSASVVFRDQFARWRAGRARDHTIVCGLDAVGARLVESLAADGRIVVAVEPDPSSPGTATAMRAGIAVITGDPTDRSVLLSARADRARRLVAITSSDATNVAITSAARDIARDGRPALRCSVRLSDGELAQLLRSTELTAGGSVRTEYFNVHERAAQALIAAHPVTGRLAVLGLGQFGSSVIVAAAQRWADRGEGPLAATLIDRRAAARLQGLVMQHPALSQALNATCIDLDIGAPTSVAVEQFERSMVDHPPSLVVVAFEDEALTWTSGLFVRRRLRRPVDIVVRTDTDGGFGHHLQRTVGSDRGGRIVSFPFVEEACSVDLIEGGVREQLARAIHDDHLARTGTSSSGLHRAWSQLDDADRESSRSAADAIVARVAALGAELVPLRQWGAAGGGLTDDEIDRIAAEEHARWMAEREGAGWTWGETRDDTLRRNPLLVEWSMLPEAARDANRQATAALPGMLARAGFEIARAEVTDRY